MKIDNILSVIVSSIKMAFSEHSMNKEDAGGSSKGEKMCNVTQEMAKQINNEWQILI